MTRAVIYLAAFAIPFVLAWLFLRRFSDDSLPRADDAEYTRWLVEAW